MYTKMSLKNTKAESIVIGWNLQITDIMSIEQRIGVSKTAAAVLTDFEYRTYKFGFKSFLIYLIQEKQYLQNTKTGQNWKKFLASSYQAFQNSKETMPRS